MSPVAVGNAVLEIKTSHVMQVKYCLFVVFIFFVAESFLFLVEMKFDLFFFRFSTLFVTLTYVTLNFLLFEKVEIKFVIEYLPVHSKHHERPICSLTINLTLSVQLSNCLSSLNTNFDLLSPVQSLPVTVTVAISERAPTATASGTVTCLSCVPRLSAIANKTTLRLTDHSPDVSVCHVSSR